MGMHRFDEETERLAPEVLDYALRRIRWDPIPLDKAKTEAELRAATGQTVTPAGLGGSEALRIFTDVLAPATISADHPMFVAFVPTAPSEAAVLFDLIVGASSIYGGAWLEGAGAIFAENEALAWLADLAGLPDGAGGVFVSGGTAGNLSALVTARHVATERRSGRPDRWKLAAAPSAHSSVEAAARVMDVDIVEVPGDDRNRLTGEALAAADLTDVFAVVATAGTTNAGQIDDLAGAADVCEGEEIWFHVDAAYGGAALASARCRPLFSGIERADSFVVDPHKWLFAPYDCAALLYREPRLAVAAHAQHAGYLDPIDRDDWNPSDLAFHLSRRVRGLPFWFSLATYGTDAYEAAIDRTIDVTQAIAQHIADREGFELVMEPQLTVVLFRRLGWDFDDYDRWSKRLLDEQIAFAVPSRWRGEAMMRFCIVNPRTRVEALIELVDSMLDE